MDAGVVDYWGQGNVFLWCHLSLRFLRTADVVDQEPWNLDRAAAALRDWVEAEQELCC